MKILMIHQHFKTPQSGGAVRSYYLAKALVGSGMEVVVITGHDQPYKKEDVDGIEVHFLKVPYNNDFGFFKRSVSFLRFVIKSVKKAGEFRDAKLCYAISVPLTVGLSARWIKRQYKIPYMFEVGDLWPDAPVQMGFVRNHFLKKLLYKLEINFYREAKSIVALSPAIQFAIENKISGKKVDLVPNMGDTDFFIKTTRDPLLEEKYKVKGKFVVSYIGAIGVANGLDYVIACAQASRKAGLPIQFIICGEGALKKKLLEEVKRQELENLSILDFTNRDGVREVLNVTDAALISYKPVPILETGSPNKFFDALAAGKLIIANFGGWIKDEIEESNCGFYADPHQPADLIKKIKPFIEDRLLLENYQFNARSLAERKYSRKDLSAKFSKIIAEAIQN
ncbi:MAG: glycosyltransferase family 4 protein [Cyclobacteriaceae bacterium]|nr:glycosyltransferase family 4 protein [Cyclobacteriaceae bacterium]